MVVAASTQESLYHWVFGPLRFAGEGRTRVVIAKKSQVDRSVRQRATRRVRREDRHSMSSALLMRLKFCQIDSRTFQKNHEEEERLEGAQDAGGTPALPVALPSSSCLPHFFLLFPPAELPRRPGAPSRRRRPSPANSGRCRRGGAPGPLVSSRAEAEAVFLFLSSSSCLPLPVFLFLSSTQGRPTSSRRGAVRPSRRSGRLSPRALPLRGKQLYPHRIL